MIGLFCSMIASFLQSSLSTASPALLSATSLSQHVHVSPLTVYCLLICLSGYWDGVVVSSKEIEHPVPIVSHFKDDSELCTLANLAFGFFQEKNT